MKPVYLLLLAAIAVACLYFARRGKKEDDSGDFVEKTKVDAERVVCVYDMDDERLQNAIDEFVNMYSDNGDVERPTVRHEGTVYRLSFSSKVDYITMCYWVNYIVYSDEKQLQRFTVRGWYPFGEVLINGEAMPFSNQTVMLYVDKDDKECDNISFVTPDGKHYLQPFAISGNLKPLDHGSESYQEMK